MAGKIVYCNNPIDMELVRAGRALDAYRQAVVFRSEGATCGRAWSRRRPDSNGVAAYAAYGIGDVRSALADDDSRDYPSKSIHQQQTKVGRAVSRHLREGSAQ